MIKFGKTIIALIVCCSLCSAYIPEAKAEETNDQNYLSDSDYKKMGLNLTNPDAFTDDDNPLTGYEPNYINELFISASNNDDAKSDEVKNGFFSQENAVRNTDLTNILKKDRTISSGANPVASGTEWQMTNAVAANLDGNEYGTQDIVQMACMYDKNARKGKVELYLHQGDKVKKLNTGDLFLSVGTESYVLDYTVDENAGYTAMAAGDYDGDGKDEVAVYVAATKGGTIQLFDIEKDGSCNKIRTFNFNNISPDQRFVYDGSAEKDRHMPVVSLSTTSISGKDDLVINVSLPMWNKSFITTKKQDAKTVIVSGHGKDGWKIVADFEYTEADKRMRFASSADGNIFGDSKDELIIAGYVNEDYSSGNILGKLNTQYNAIGVVGYDSERGYYRNFDKMKLVPALTGKGLQINDRSDMPSLEPACLAAANLSGGSRDHIFLEGIILNYNESNGTFIQQGSLALEGDNDAFIKTAAVGAFSAENPGREQIYVLSGDHYSANHDLIYLDVSLIQMTNTSEVKAEVFRNDLYYQQNEDDNSTWFNFCTANVDKDNIYVRYKGKETGWSRPEVYTVMQSPPYWKELYYGDQIYGSGSATYTISSGRSTNDTGNWGIGVGVGLGVRASAGVGLLGNKITGGAGMDVDLMLNYLGSYSQESSFTQTNSITVPPGEDNVVLFAVPAVTYQYEVYIPAYTVTQNHIDTYNEMKEAGGEGEYNYQVGDEVSGHWEEANIKSEFGPTFTSMSVDKYNDLIKTMPGMKDMKPIKGLPEKTSGDPTTYPKNEETLKNVPDAKNVMVSTASASTGSDEAARTLEVEYEKSKTETHGFLLAYDAAVVQTMDVEVQVGIDINAHFESKFKGHIEGGYSRAEGKVSSNAFQAILADYPSDAGPNYAFSTRLGVYNAGQLTPQDVNGDGPYVLSYVVEGADEQNVPPMYPLNLKVYNTTPHEIVLNWENSTYRKTGSYEIFRENSEGSYVSVGKVDGTDTFFVDTGLDPDTVYRYKMTAYQGQGQTGVKSARSQPVQGKTKTLADYGPQITKQPDSLGVEVGAEPEFRVEALPGNPAHTLSYQWQRYEVPSDSSVGTFEDIEGATEATYTFGAVTEENKEDLDGNVYRVQVTESNSRAVNSRAVTLFVNSQTKEYQQTETKASVSTKEGEPLFQIGSEFYVKESQTLQLSGKVVQLGTDTAVQTGTVVFAILDENGRIEKITGGKLDGQGVSAADRLFQPGTYRVEAWYLGNIDDSAAADLYLASNSNVIKLSVAQPDQEETYYKIKYQLDGGIENSQNPTVFTKDSGIIELHPAGNKDGAVFNGWYLDEARTVRIDRIDASQAEMQKDLLIYAGWDEKEYPIVYELNGGTNASQNPQTYTVSTPDIRLMDASYAGYQFEGWYQEPEFKNRVMLISKGSTGEKKLYAKWTEAAKPPVPSPDDEKHYEIYTMQDLYNMAANVNGGDEAYVNATYQLMNNIDGQGAIWNTPIGAADHPFNGTLEGDNYTIHNMKMEGSEQALFHTIGTAGQVKNLRLYTIAGNGEAKNAASFAINNKGVLNHCHAGINVESSIHVTEDGQVSLDTFNSHIAASETAGGLVAFNEGSIMNSVSSAIVKASVSGGLAGSNRGNIANGYNTGQITGSQVAGGIVGKNSKEGTLFNLYSCGSMSGTYTGGIAGKSENKKITKCYFNSSDDDACSDQSSIDAVYIRSADMKTKAFAERLSENIEKESGLTGWYQEDERNAGYPRLYNQGMAKSVLSANEYGITLSGYGIHRNAKLQVTKIEPGSEIYEQFKAQAGNTEIQQVYDIVLVDENGKKMDYDSPLTLRFTPENWKPMDRIQILHRLDEVTIKKLTKPENFEETGTIEIKSLSAFAITRGGSADEGHKTPGNPNQSTEQKPDQNQAIKGVKTGDTKTPDIWLFLMLLAVLSIAGVTIRRKVGR